MPLRDWHEAIDARLQRLNKVTGQTIGTTLAQREHFRGSVRVATGRIYTTEEYEERRNRVLNTALP